MKAAQRALRDILAADAPVALIPGYAHSLATPDKSWGPYVGVFGVIHADDDTNVNFALNHGREWAACICVSGRVAARVRTVAPWLALVVIPNGVPCVSRPPIKSHSDKGSPLRVIYAGRLEQKQKRVRDLATLVEIAAEQRLDVIWEIAGEGSEAGALRSRMLPFIESGTVRWHGALPREAVRGLFAGADLMLMLSEYEGMPMTLLEAMAECCVPVVTEGCDAGAELVRSHNAGFVLPTGDMQRFAETLHALATNREQLAKFGERAWNAVAHGEHNSVAMGKAYRQAVSEWWSSLSPEKSVQPFS
jgi:glycosyltransferase involved in cell wall biosynthesis